MTHNTIEVEETSPPSINLANTSRKEDSKLAHTDSEFTNDASHLQTSKISFINIGMKHWEQERAKWISSSHPGEQNEANTVVSQTINIPTTDSVIADNNNNKGAAITQSNVNLEEVVGIIFTNRWRNTTGDTTNGFSHPVPLPLMIEILVDVWEAEGLDI